MTESKCPFHHTAGTGRSNRDWWPNQLKLQILHQNSPLLDPMGEGFDYATEFQSLDLAALKKELHALMTDSQEWWPADFGHYRSSFAWPGTAPAPIASATDAVVPVPDSSALHRSTAGRTT
jgi:catalase-peroxidase